MDITNNMITVKNNMQYKTQNKVIKWNVLSQFHMCTLHEASKTKNKIKIKKKITNLYDTICHKTQLYADSYTY